MLADLGRDIDVLVLRQVIEPLQRVLRHDHAGGRLVLQAFLGAPALDLLPPGLVCGLVRRPGFRLPEAQQVFQHVGAIADDRQLHAHVLVDRRRVDVDVNLDRVRREGVDTAGDAVVKARADVDHHVAVVHGHVGLVGAVHAEHAEPLLVGRRIGAEPHQGRGDGEARQFHQLAKELAGFRARIDDAAAGVEHRPLGCRHDLDGFLQRRRVSLELRPVALVRHGGGGRRHVGADGELHILRNVDDDGARPAALGDMECLVQDAREIVDVLDQPVVLGARPRDADRVALLEGIVADQMRRHLARQHHDGDRIHQRVGEPGDRVRGAGTGGHQHDADFAGGTGVALGCVHGATLLAHEDVLDLLLLKDLVVDGQHGAAGIAEDVLDTLVGKRLEDDFGAGHRACHVRDSLRPAQRDRRSLLTATW